MMPKFINQELKNLRKRNKMNTIGMNFKTYDNSKQNMTTYFEQLEREMKLSQELLKRGKKK